MLVWAHGVLLQSLFSLFFDAQIVPHLASENLIKPVSLASSQVPPFSECLLTFYREDVSGLSCIFCAPVLESVIASGSLSFFQWRDRGLGVSCGVEGQMSLFVGFLSRCYRQPRVSVCAHTWAHSPPQRPVVFSVFMSSLYVNICLGIHTRTYWNCYLDFCICSSSEFLLLKPKWFWNS